jgi:hypothetical protein
VLFNFNLRIFFGVTIIFICVAALTGCTEDSEAEQLAQLRDSFTYKQYRRVSEKGLALGLQGFLKASKASGVKEIPKVTPEELCVLRMMLAFAEVTRKKHTMALAETDIIESDKHCTQTDRTIATSIRAIIFHNLEWPGLAQEESRRARAADIVMPVRSFNERLIMAHLCMATLYGSEKQWDKAKFHVDGIATMLELPWLSKVADFALAIEEKRVKDAIRIAQELSQDPSVPEEVRTYFAELYHDIGGDFARITTDPKYLVEMVTRVIWNAAKSKGSEQWKKITAYVDGYDSAALSKDMSGAMDSAKSGYDKLLDKTGMGKKTLEQSNPDNKSQGKQP